MATMEQQANEPSSQRTKPADFNLNKHRKNSSQQHLIIELFTIAQHHRRLVAVECVIKQHERKLTVTADALLHATFLLQFQSDSST